MHKVLTGGIGYDPLMVGEVPLEAYALSSVAQNKVLGGVKWITMMLKSGSSAFLVIGRTDSPTNQQG